MAARKRPVRWPLTVWLEVPRPGTRRGWHRITCLGTYSDTADLPSREELDAMAAAAADRLGPRP